MVESPLLAFSAGKSNVLLVSSSLWLFLLDKVLPAPATARAGPVEPLQRRPLQWPSKRMMMMLLLLVVVVVYQQKCVFLMKNDNNDNNNNSTTTTTSTSTAAAATAATATATAATAWGEQFYLAKKN